MKQELLPKMASQEPVNPTTTDLAKKLINLNMQLTGNSDRETVKNWVKFVVASDIRRA